MQKNLEIYLQGFTYLYCEDLCVYIFRICLYILRIYVSISLEFVDIIRICLYSFRIYVSIYLEFMSLSLYISRIYVSISLGFLSLYHFPIHNLPIIGPFIKTLVPEDSKHTNARPRLISYSISVKKKAWVAVFADYAINLAHMCFPIRNQASPHAVL